MVLIIKKLLRKTPRLYTAAQRIYPFITVLSALLVGRRGSCDHLRSSWSLLRKSTFVAGRPVNITLEPTNVCNLRCPVCETGSGELERPSRRMSLAEFKNILDRIASHTNTLMFYYMGEPFLNQEAYAMIRLAKEYGIPWVTTCTNGDLIDPEKLVASGIDEISFQIGGMSSETHSIYRINGDFENVMSKLKETLRLRKEQQKPMRVNCGMILMQHNEHEVAEFHRVMNELGVDEAVAIDPCVRTMAQAEMYLPSDERHWIYDPQAFRAGVLRPRVLPGNRCDWLNYSLTILANGDVVPCCRDPKGEHVMGNLHQQELSEIWNGVKYRDFRGAVLKDQAKMEICRLCSGYPASALK